MGRKGSPDKTAVSAACRDRNPCMDPLLDRTTTTRSTVLNLAGLIDAVLDAHRNRFSESIDRWVSTDQLGHNSARTPSVELWMRSHD